MPSELIVLSHLRWDWVWQRPQHIVSRLAGESDRTVWFVEEPMPGAGDSAADNTLVVEEVDGIRRVFLQIADPGHHVGYSDEVLPLYIDQLTELLGDADGQRVVWLYTPLALEAALALNPTTLVYDVMDDLAAFKDAAPELVSRQRQALERADVVFAGGRSLHRSVVAQRRADAILVPSGVTAGDFAVARRDRASDERPVAGYVGVLDERLDLELVRGLAEQLPEWTIRMIGPLAKIDEASLPVAPNIEYLGKQDYRDLPALMAGLDVALMPFALNEATRSISPTKTLEYLAAGLPVVSTAIADVVADFSDVVEIRADAEGFAEACRRAAASPPDSASVASILARNEWDAIASRMEDRVFASERSGTALHTTTGV